MILISTCSGQAAAGLAGTGGRSGAGDVTAAFPGRARRSGAAGGLPAGRAGCRDPRRQARAAGSAGHRCVVIPAWLAAAGSGAGTHGRR
jgi:hypothetical protein